MKTKEKSIGNGLFFIFMVIVFIINCILAQGCKKVDTNPTDVILWENSSDTTRYVDLDGVKFPGGTIGLKPNQSRLFGSEDLIGRTYHVKGKFDKYVIEKRNSIK